MLIDNIRPLIPLAALRIFAFVLILDTDNLNTSVLLVLFLGSNSVSLAIVENWAVALEDGSGSCGDEMSIFPSTSGLELSINKSKASRGQKKEQHDQRRKKGGV